METVADASFVDVVHDNVEVYAIAASKYAARHPSLLAARVVRLLSVPWEWVGDERHVVREKSKLLLMLHVFNGQRLLYQPLGRNGARTNNGWYLPTAPVTVPTIVG